MNALEINSLCKTFGHHPALTDINLKVPRGAIFGLLFLYVVLALRAGSVPTTLLVMIGINIALPLFVPGIAWQAHAGGAVTGAVIGGLLTLTSAPGRSEQARRRRRLIWPGLAGIAVLLAAVAVWRILAVMGPGAFTLA